MPLPMPAKPRGSDVLTSVDSGWGARFLDYDNDGRKDLLVAQGHVLDTVELTFPNLRYREPMLLAWNTETEFVEAPSDEASPLRQPWQGREKAVGDIDNDGRVDAVVTTNDGPVHLLRNKTATPNHWLILKLVGHTSNRDAIGAEVKIVTKAHSQVATVTTASSYLSSGDKRLHFGGWQLDGRLGDQDPLAERRRAKAHWRACRPDPAGRRTASDDRLPAMTQQIRLAGTLLLLAIVAIRTGAQQEGSTHQSQPLSGVSTGRARPPVKDAQSRPITAGGFVDDAPIVFEDITEKAGLECVSPSLRQPRQDDDP